MNDIFGRKHNEAELLFFKNPDTTQPSFKIDFEELFVNDWEIETASNGEMTCPILKELPNKHNVE